MRRFRKFFLTILVLPVLTFVIPHHVLAAACDNHDSWQQSQQECGLQDGRQVIVYFDGVDHKYSVAEIDGSRLYAGTLTGAQDWLNSHGATAGFASNLTSSKTKSTNSGCSKDSFFFFIPPWWEYLPDSKFAADCSIQNFAFPNDLLAVGLAVVDMLLRVAGLVAIVSIIIAGVAYMTAGGDVQKTASARKRIYNALIGLAIVAIASGLVAFIGNTLVK